MRYSVYDYDRKVYDYYDGPGPGGTHAGSPPIRRGRNELGAYPEQATWKVPMGAKRIGSGVMPQGRISSLDGIDLEIDLDPITLGAIALLVYFLIVK